NILYVIGEHIALKKTGAYYKGRCPFHSEKTASFTVSPDKDIFYCFGCQLGGDVISFISKIENCSQLEAANILKERYNIDLPIYNFESENLDKKKRYIKINEIFLKWIQGNLNNEVKDYLNLRSISLDSIKKFEIGFMPSGANIVKELILFAQQHNILASDLLEVKILSRGKYTMYSPFEGRIIFPIKDHLGALVGFGGRIIKEKDDRAKYYNSHDNKFFSKGSLLFGLDHAKNMVKKKNAIFLVEGYIDAILMSQNGFAHTVATLGTAFTKDHLNLLSRYTNRLYLLYDQDDAGQNAINRLIMSYSQTNIDIYVISLPDGEDPASFLSKGLDLKSLILKAKDIFKFYIDSLNTSFQNAGINEKAKIIKKVIDIVSNIPDKLKQDMLLKQVSEIFDIKFEILRTQLYSSGPTNPENLGYAPEKIENSIILDTSKISQLEKKIISAIIDNKEDIKSIAKEDMEFLILSISPEIKELFINLVNNKDDSELTLEEKSVISKIVIEANNSNTLEQLIASFYKKQWKVLVDDIKFKIKQAEKTGDKDEINKLLSSLELLKKKILKRA
ncbi:MAG: DNA primase, partial [Novosphingobium sp.]|nr:DNA primase [Novosphingobium sp.]